MNMTWQSTTAKTKVDNRPFSRVFLHVLITTPECSQKGSILNTLRRARHQQLDTPDCQSAFAHTVASGWSSQPIGFRARPRKNLAPSSATSLRSALPRHRDATSRPSKLFTPSVSLISYHGTCLLSAFRLTILNSATQDQRSIQGGIHNEPATLCID